MVFMIILMSKYRAPFSEPPQEGVHYISLDDQADMNAGRYDAHVRLYRSLAPKPTIDIHNAFTGESYTHELTYLDSCRPFAKNRPVIDEEDHEKFTRELSLNFGVHAANNFLKDSEKNPKPKLILIDCYTKPEEEKPLKKSRKPSAKQQLFEKLLKMKKDE